MSWIRQRLSSRPSIIINALLVGVFITGLASLNVGAAPAWSPTAPVVPPVAPTAQDEGGWCPVSEPVINNGTAADCHLNNIKKLGEIPGIAGTPQASEDNYVAMIDKCKKNSGGFTGSCGNAYVTCLQTTTESARCDNPDYVSAIASDCNAGKLEGNRDASDCGPIKTANDQTVKAANDAIEGSVKAACKGTDTGVKALQDDAVCQKAYTDAETSCKKQFGIDVTNQRTNMDDYNACVKKAIQAQAQDNPNLCKGAGGIPMANDTKDPNGPNTLKKGCYYQASDLTNPQACQAANKGFVWTKIEDGQPNHYECKDPSAAASQPCSGPGQGGVDPNDSTKCKDGSTVGQAQGPGGDVGHVTTQCGEARVNILSCGTERGGVALNNVLKIIISALSVIVAIAAVGGLAWASVLYAKAGDNEGNVSEAKTLIRNVIIGILLYVFLVAIVGWLVPGSVIS
jgi:hypothetical protein